MTRFSYCLGLFVAAGALAMPQAGLCAVHTVGPDGDYTNTWAGVQSAMTAAFANSEDDEIRIVGGIRIVGTGGNDTQLTRAAGDSYGLRISGGWNAAFSLQSGSNTVLDANVLAIGNNCRVFNLHSKTTLEYLDITGGRRGNDDGAGILVDNAATGTRLSHLNIYSNRLQNNKYGGGIYNAATGTVVEFCNIHGNIDASGSGAYGLGIATETRICIMNSRIADHSGVQTNSYAAGIFFLGANTTPHILFGCLMTGNKLAAGQAGGAAFRTHYDSNASITPRQIYMGNCTVADNGLGGESQYAVYLNSLAAQRQLVAKNCIFSDNQAGVYDNRATPVTLAYSVKDDPFSIGGVFTEVDNNAADPQFLNRVAGNYALVSGSPALNLGTNVLVMTDGEETAAFGGPLSAVIRYVDLNGGGVYDALVDVVVELGGHVPSADAYINNFIYVVDLDGKPRFKQGRIDAGAYEWQPARGTVITIR